VGQIVVETAATDLNRAHPQPDMSSDALGRTIRRGVATLLLPLSLLLFVHARYLASPYGRNVPLDVLQLSSLVGAALFVGAGGYLLVSLGAQVGSQ
jgi:hypothetical protein